MDALAEIKKQYFRRINSYLLNYKPIEIQSNTIEWSLANKNRRKLTIAYIMNHVRVCGGVKVIFEHTNRLAELGHKVYIISHANRPDWYELKAKFISVPYQFSLAQYIPEDVDIVICTVADQLPQCFLLSDKPVVMFEQGDSYIFEFEKLSSKEQKYFKKLWSFPVPIFGVSQVLLNTLERHFNVHGTVIHNALDPNTFYPRMQNYQNTKPTILFVGREDVPFKGINDIRRALEIVRDSGRDFEEIWITQTKPISPFNGKLFINPKQSEIGNIYRMSDIYVSGSYYESFSLPPLEAMACGCAVVSTDNGGILEYAQDGINCLLADAGDYESLAKCIIELIDDQQKREALVENGYKTVSRFKWGNIISEWENRLISIVDNWKPNRYPELLIKHLSPNTSQLEAERIIQSVVSQMDEEYCLWLVEGETISDADIKRIKHTLSHNLSSAYALQVHYKNDIPEHPIVRLETRIYKRNTRVSDIFQPSMILPIQIEGGIDSCYLPDWLRETRLRYSHGDFGYIISYLKNKYPDLSPDDKPIAVKWLALALMERERDRDCLDILSKALQEFPSYSDIGYLLGRVLLYAGDVNRAMPFFRISRLAGTAALYNEYFLDMDKLCDMYLHRKAINEDRKSLMQPG